MTKIRFQPLKIRRLSEIIEESIKDLILTGQLKPGSRLPTEAEIGRQFGVSTVTVRQALRGLEAFGIVEKKRGKDGGIFVSETKSDVVKSAINIFLSSRKLSAQDLSQVRIIVEPATVAIAASRITPEELKGLEDNINHCKKCLGKAGNAFSEKDFFEIEERNVEFHRLIGEATHNAILALMVDYLEDFLLSFKKAKLVPDIRFSAKSVEGHSAIFNAIKKRNAQEAEQHMLHHIKLVEDYLASKERKRPGVKRKK